ncbi:MAG: hypothetical protein GKR89_07175 [Candidatus Latescibacteria bacterium]|nr:hypothetical protein [Candidatus Latescibacterota bacterium]
MATEGLSKAQQAQYGEVGFTVVPGLFGRAECADFVAHMMDLHAGRKQLDGFARREADEWGRTHNQHNYDVRAEALLIEPRLQAPLRDCLGDEPDGIQTMYFYKGSEQRRHQDQFYLPGCMSAWIALDDADQDNGALRVQPGSHKGHLLTKTELETMDGTDYNDAVDRLFADNGLPEEIVEVKLGDVVFFNGVLIHRGGPIAAPDSFRHAMANHYIGHSFTDWPHTGWWRIGFDGSRRH